MSAQFDPILGQMRDGAVTLAEQTAGYNKGSAAEKAAFQSSVSGGGAILKVAPPTSGDAVPSIASEIAGSRTPTRTSPLRVVLQPGAYTFASTLVLPSNTLLDLTGCSINVGNPAQVIITNRAAITSVRAVADGVLTADSNVLQSATINFTSADVGRTLVSTKGSAGNSADPYMVACTFVVGVIKSIVSPSQAVITGTASVSATAATFTLYDRDENISVVGDKSTMITRDTAASINGKQQQTILISRCDGVFVRDLSFQSTQGKYFVNTIDCTHQRIARVWLPSTNSDGIHVTGPARNVRICDITGNTGDDMVAIGASDYSIYTDSQGSISDVRIDGVQTVGGYSGGVAVFGLANDKYHKISDVRVSNVSGPFRNWLMRIQSGAGDTNTFFDDIEVDKFTPGGAVAAAAPMHFDCRNFGTVTFRNLVDDGGTSGANFFGGICTGKTLNVFDFKRSVSSTAPSGACITVGSVVETLNVTGVFNFGSASAADGVQLAGQLSTLNLGATFNNRGGSTNVTLVKTSVSQSKLVINAANVTASGYTGCYEFWLSGAVDVNFANCALGTSYMGVRAVNSGSVVTVRGSGVTWAPTIAMEGAAGTTIHPRSLALYGEADRPNLSKAAGNAMYNTKGALSCGVGYIIADGTAFKNLYTAATY